MTIDSSLILSASIAEYTDVSGFTSFNLLGAITGHFNFASATGRISGDEITYHATDGPNVEIGTGIYTEAGISDPASISRDTILTSSNGGGKVFWSGNTRPIIRELTTGSGTVSTTGLPWAPYIWLAGPNFGGRKPNAGEILFYAQPTIGGVSFPVNLSGSRGGCGSQTPLDGNAIFGLYVNGVLKITITIPQFSTSANFVGSAFNVNATDAIWLTCPNPADSRLADIYFTFYGTRL